MKEVTRKLSDKLWTGALFCIKWRYLVALVVFIFCVALNLHGSSINEYNKMFANEDKYSSEQIVFGESRWIRSDEWLIHTPYYMSQQYNDYKKVSNMMSLEGQDMIVGYNAPVLDVSAIAKPFTWGYFLFGNDRGLSWYWCSKLILLILISFELCMIVTKKNKKISLLGTLLISFAPAIQWWFVPHMVDVFFWGMSVLVLSYHFFVSKGWWRILWMFLLPLAVVTFVLALFPSLQVAVGLAMLALFIGLMIRDKKAITFKKKDIWRIIVMVLLVLGILGYTIWTSMDAIIALHNTVYPGSRATLGGKSGIDDLFTDLTTFALPFKDVPYYNNSEVSTFIHFAPIILMLYPVIYKKMKRDRNIIVGNTLVITLSVMMVFMLAGFPELLARITGFSYINRMEIAYGLVATIFTIWGINMIWQKKIFTKKQIFVVLVIYGFLYVCFVGADELSYYSWKYYAIAITGLLVLAYLLLMNRKKLFSTGLVLLIVISGFTINPIAKGTSALFDHPLEQKIHEIALDDKEAYWLTLGNTRLESLGIANGARVLNMTNFYPDYGKWKLIDPDGEYDKIYNRYARIYVEITDKKTEMEVSPSPDAMTLRINYKDLDKWPVKYLLTTAKLDKGKKMFEEVYEDTEGSYFIYKKIDNQ